MLRSQATSRRTGMSRPTSSWSASARRAWRRPSPRTNSAPRSSCSRRRPRARKAATRASPGRAISTPRRRRRPPPISPRCAGDFAVPEAMVKVWAEEMCRNNAMAGGPRRRSAGAPASPRRHRVSGAAGLRLRAQVPRWTDLRLFAHLEDVRAAGQGAADLHSLRDAGPGADPGRHRPRRSSACARSRAASRSPSRRARASC